MADNSYHSELEDRLTSRSEHLEDIHLDAAIDAQLTVVPPSPSPLVAPSSENSEQNQTNDPSGDDVIFDDYTNPNAVKNCLSPYVPSKSYNIQDFFDLVGLDAKDVLLDIGCGDGRVCISAVKMTGCNAVGIDVSPPCIKMANEIASEEGLAAKRCSFYQLDATISPERFLSDASPLHDELETVTVIFLYTFPTLLVKLIPLLSRMTDGKNGGNVRAVATLTYHLPDDQVILSKIDERNDIRIYERVFNKGDAEARDTEKVQK